MRENERSASTARAEAAMAMKTLLIVLLSTMLLPRVLLLPLYATQQTNAGSLVQHPPWQLSSGPSQTHAVRESSEQTATG